jgi:hypothetical protein
VIRLMRHRKPISDAFVEVVLQHWKEPAGIGRSGRKVVS